MAISRANLRKQMEGKMKKVKKFQGGRGVFPIGAGGGRYDYERHNPPGSKTSGMPDYAKPFFDDYMKSQKEDAAEARRKAARGAMRGANMPTTQGAMGSGSGMKKGGKVRGSGCCKRTKKCKMY